MIIATAYIDDHKHVNQSIIQTVYEKVQNLSVEQVNEVLAFIDFVQFKSTQSTQIQPTQIQPASDDTLDKKQYAIDKLKEIGKQAEIGDVVSPIDVDWQLD